MISLSPLRLCVSALIILSVSAHAAQTNWNASARAFPAVARAIERRRMAPAKPKVAFQRIEHGTVISVLQDGTVVSAPLKKAVTARIPEALGRVRIDAALARIAAAAEGEGEGADNAKRAEALEKLADKLEKENAKGNGKAKAAGSALLAAATAAAGYLAGRKARAA